MRRLARVRERVTPLAISTAVLCAACLMTGRWLGSPAFGFMGAGLAAVLVLSALAVLLPARIGVRVIMRPRRTVVGAVSEAQLTVTNEGILPVISPLLEVRMLGEVHRRRLGVLHRHRSLTQTLSVPGVRRGVHLIGPVEVYRQDPLWLFGRRAGSSSAVEFYVRPRTVAVPDLGLGQTSDLEGVASDEISMSDLSFHALREYVPGDDLRHVHWRSSAKANQLLVRQYHDTRRSKITVLVDTERSAYRKGAEFELALSVAASLLMRAAQDGLDIAFHMDQTHLINGSLDDVLDSTCRAELGECSLRQLALRAHAEGVGGSLGMVVVITGGQRGVKEVQRLLVSFPDDMRTLLLRADSGLPDRSRLRSSGSLVEAELSELGHLPALMDQFLWGRS